MRVARNQELLQVQFQLLPLPKQGLNLFLPHLPQFEVLVATHFLGFGQRLLQFLVALIGLDHRFGTRIFLGQFPVAVFVSRRARVRQQAADLLEALGDGVQFVADGSFHGDGIC